MVYQILYFAVSLILCEMYYYKSIGSNSVIIL